jgi:hypothetical protein
MKRRTLDLIFSVGGTAAAVLILVLALVLQNQANFARRYVHDQLGQEKITFTPAAGLKPDESAPCLKKYAGQLMTNGAQAECYANDYIGVHVTLINNGKTYSETSNEARAKVTAKEGQATTLFQGETLRGLLLTSYGFSIFGQRAGQAALVAFALAAVLFLASIAGFVHARTRSADHEILAHTS